MVYGVVLVAHSWLRWLVLALGLALLTISLRGWRSALAAWPEGLERLRRGFLAALDAQMLLGIVLYAVLSPLSPTGMSDLGAAMSEPILRFYTVEHVVGMIAAIVVAHAGSRKAMRADVPRRYRMLLLTQALWLLVTLASIPWPGLPYGRPLLRVP